jgi:copper(I)-binding protein
MKLLALAVASFLAAFAGAACAQTTKLSALEITDPWIPVPPKGAHVAAGYLTIANKGSAADRLVAVSATFAKRAEVHEMTMDGGVMRMRPLKDGLEIKPGETVELKSGSYHIMFFDPGAALTAGDHAKATLQFATAGNIELDFTIKPMGSKPAAPKMDHMAPMAPMH